MITAEIPLGGIQEQQYPAEREARTETLQYLAGIFDVSGSITIQHNPATTRRGESFSLRLDLSRTNPTIIKLMNQAFPATTDDLSTPPDEKKRHRWYAKSRKAEEVIEALRPYLILKFGHLQVVDDFLALKGVRTAQESDEFKRAVAHLNKTPIVRSNDVPLPDAYVAGIFDAHGSLSLHTQIRQPGLGLNVTVNNLPLMEQVAQYFESTIIPQKNPDGTIRSYAVSPSAKKALEKLNQIYPHLRLLKDLADLGIEFQNLRNSPGSRSKYQERKLQEAQLVAQAQAIIQAIGRRSRKPF